MINIKQCAIFAHTWFSLDAYDKSKLPTKGATPKKIDLSADELINDIQELKTQLIKKHQATELFAKERNLGNIQNIFRNIHQSFGGKEIYPSVEAKAEPHYQIIPYFSNNSIAFFK